MKMDRRTPRKRPSTVAEHKLDTRFRLIRDRLLDKKFSDRRQQSLAYWALPSDRRLPLALLDRTVDDLLSTPFQEILATPGVGQKKLTSLITLLTRATRQQPGEEPAEPSQTTRAETNGFCFDNVSEALWSQWRETVRRHRLQRERLGRLAPTLEALPTVIWSTPLSTYVDRTLAEIRAMKTHGEKRVRVILEVFSVVHDALGEVAASKHLQFRIVPPVVEQVERWLTDTIESNSPPSHAELRTSLVEPLLAQIRTDLGENVFALATDRVGLEGPPQSVRRQARDAGLTRARIYQLFEDCAKAMHVRWPEGACRLAAFAPLMSSPDVNSETRRMFEAAQNLFFPRSEDDEEGNLK
jgi:hypothetical protein